MKKLNVMIIASCAFALITSCKSSKNVLQTSDLNGEWNIIEVNGQQTTSEKEPFIGLDIKNKRVYGFAGCNRIMGSFEADSQEPGKLAFGQLGTTRMMCQNMDTERAILGALSEVTGYEGNAEKLSLTNKKGKDIITLEKRMEATVQALEGKWNIALVNGATIESIEKTEKKPFLAFNVAEKKVHGNGGCNIINGGFTQEKDQSSSLKFTQMISTMMAGPGMNVERQVLEAIDSVRSFRVKDSATVALLNENGKEVLTLVKE